MSDLPLRPTNTDDDDREDCPQGGKINPETGKCQFKYNDFLAARYALRYAGRVNLKFCGYNYVLAENRTFNQCAAGNNTDCANFVSQPLLYGGLPMTTNWNANRTSRNAIGADKTPAWSGAIQLPSYLKTLHDDPDTALIDSLGEDLPDIHTRPSHPPAMTDPPTHDDVTAQQVMKITKALEDLDIGRGDIMYTTTPRIQHVAMIVGWGPYLVYWQDIYNFVQGLEMRPHPNDQNDPDFDKKAIATKLSAKRNARCPIPYVVDHGNHYLFGQPQYVDEEQKIRFNFNQHKNDERRRQPWAAGPKPYYALLWGAPKYMNSQRAIMAGGPTSTAASIPWGFVHIPRIIEFDREDLVESPFESREDMLDDQFSNWVHIEARLMSPLDGDEE